MYSGNWFEIIFADLGMKDYKIYLTFDWYSWNRCTITFFIFLFECGCVMHGLYVKRFKILYFWVGLCIDEIFTHEIDTFYLFS